MTQIVETRVGRNVDVWEVLIITADGRSSNYKAPFASMEEAEAFALGLREGLELFAAGATFSGKPPPPR